MARRKTVIVTGASQGIGAGLGQAFLKEGYNVLATSRNVGQTLAASPTLVLVDSDIGKRETAVEAVEAAIKRFGHVDVLVNNAGLFYTKPFTEFSSDDFSELVSTNLLRFLLHHSAHLQRDAEAEIGERHQHYRRSCRSANRRSKWFGSGAYKGKLECGDSSLVIEYAKGGMRFNAVAPGVVDTPMNRVFRRTFLRRFSQWGKSPRQKMLSMLSSTRRKQAT